MSALDIFANDSADTYRYPQQLIHMPACDTTTSSNSYLNNGPRHWSSYQPLATDMNAYNAAFKYINAVGYPAQPPAYNSSSASFPTPASTCFYPITDDQLGKFPSEVNVQQQQQLQQQQLRCNVQSIIPCEPAEQQQQQQLCHQSQQCSDVSDQQSDDCEQQNASKLDRARKAKYVDRLVVLWLLYIICSWM
jgi:hypothetical protein